MFLIMKVSSASAFLHKNFEHTSKHGLVKLCLFKCRPDAPSLQIHIHD